MSCCQHCEYCTYGWKGVFPWEPELVQDHHLGYYGESWEDGECEDCESIQIAVDADRNSTVQLLAARLDDKLFGRSQDYMQGYMSALLMAINLIELKESNGKLA